MISISATIKEIIEEDEQIVSLFKSNLLNLSSYARSIHAEVEKRTMKNVQIKSIIVALSRLAKTYPKENDILALKIESLSIHANLEDISFEKTTDNLAKIAQLTALVSSGSKTFFTIIQGITQITIIADSSFIKTVKQVFGESRPFVEVKKLTGITIKTDLSYLHTPNIFYMLVRSLQFKKISITEISSTTTEVTFIVKNEDAQIAITQLSKFLS